MTELDEPFIIVGGSFKSYVEKSITIRDLLPYKKLNQWDIMLYNRIHNYFHQKQHLGLHEKLLINSSQKINLWSWIVVFI